VTNCTLNPQAIKNAVPARILIGRGPIISNPLEDMYGLTSYILPYKYKCKLFDKSISDVFETVIGVSFIDIFFVFGDSQTVINIPIFNLGTCFIIPYGSIFWAGLFWKTGSKGFRFKVST
jgi:hypothetical protein